MLPCPLGPLFCYGVLFSGLYSSAIRFRAFELALSEAGDKGIINIGSGCARTPWGRRVCQHPQVQVNVDLEDGGPGFYMINLELATLPFRDKEFGCAYASHVLEHLENWEAALNEWARVAEHVVIVVPHPLALTGWLAREHRQHFNFTDKAYMETRWPNVRVFM